MEKLKNLTLRETQEKVLNLCKDNKRFGVFMDMGTGKTATMLELVDFLAFETMEIERILIIAPPTVINKAKVWQNEIKKWKNFHFFDFVELNGTPDERVLKKKEHENTIFLMSDALVDWYEEKYKNLKDFDMIIIDESSRFKNHKAKKFRALLKMVEPKHRIYLLSGTPMPNGYDDLWSQMFLLDGGKRMEDNYYRFLNKYAHYLNDYKYVFMKSAKDILREKVEDICIFADSKDIKLPPLTTHTINLSWSDEKKKIYNDFKKSYVLELEKGDLSVLTVTAFINKTLQMANGCVYIDKDLNYEVFDNTKYNWLKDFIKVAHDNMLVFYAFKFDKKRLLKLDGAREIRTEQDVVDWNKGLIKVGVISPYSFQYGANLQFGGSIIVWFGLLWGLENYLQSNKRIWRPGQEKEVHIYYLFIEGTNDHYVYRRLIAKDLDEQEFLDYIKI